MDLVIALHAQCISWLCSFAGLYSGSHMGEGAAGCSRFTVIITSIFVDADWKVSVRLSKVKFLTVSHWLPAPKNQTDFYICFI